MSTSYKKPTAAISDRLREAIELRHLSSAELSRQTGISNSAISNYLSGRYVPKHDRIIKMSNTLRVNPNWLAGYDVDVDSNVQLFMFDNTEAPENKIINYKGQYSTSELNKLKELYDKQIASLNRATTIIEEAEASLHASAQKHFVHLLSRYNRLSDTNRQIIDTTIDTLLNAQGDTKKDSSDEESE